MLMTRAELWKDGVFGSQKSKDTKYISCGDMAQVMRI